MATLDLGKIKPLYKGFYSPTTSFEPLDFTIFNGVLFVNKQACTGVEPTDIGYFDPININSTDLLALIKQVDGPGSELDADTLDGLHASELQTTITGAASSITLDNLPPSSVVVTDGNGKIAALQTVSPTELAMLDGVTLNVQAQLNAKQATIVGAASSVTDTDLAPLMAVVTNADGKIAASTTISAEELSFLEGVTSAIQTQLDTKLGELDLVDYLKKVFISPNTVLVANADSKATSSTVTVAELENLADNAILATSPTGAAKLPSGSAANRPTGVTGMLRYNTELSQFEGYNGSVWSSVTGTAAGTSFNPSGNLASTNVQAALQELDSETIKTGHFEANLIRINATGTGNNPSELGVELLGNGGANTVKPGVGFHQPTLFSGTLTQEDANTFAFKKQDGARAALRVNTIHNYYTPRMASFQHNSNGQVNIYAECDPYDIIWPRGNFLQVNRGGYYTFLLLGTRTYSGTVGDGVTAVGRIYQNGGLVAEVSSGADDYGHAIVMATYTSGYVPAGTQYQFRCDGGSAIGDGIIFAFWTDGDS